MTTRSLCVTADDYGLHATVNAAIEQLAEAGRITAVAVMVHDGADLRTIDRLRATGVALGLHLTFTQERPLRGELTTAPLGRGGRLPDNPYSLTRRLVRSRRARRLLRSEARAQLSRYRSLGLPLDFINSHEHVHEVPVVWRNLAPLIAATGCGAIRSAAFQPARISRQGALAVLARAADHRSLGGMRVLSPLGAGFAGHMTLARIHKLVATALRRGGGALPELVVHPALCDRTLHSRYGPSIGERRAEFDLLGGPAIESLWRRLGVTLVHPTAAHSPGQQPWTYARTNPAWDSGLLVSSGSQFVS